MENNTPLTPEDQPAGSIIPIKIEDFTIPVSDEKIDQAFAFYRQRLRESNNRIAELERENEKKRDALQQILELNDYVNMSSFNQMKEAIQGSIEIADTVLSNPLNKSLMTG